MSALALDDAYSRAAGAQPVPDDCLFKIRLRGQSIGLPVNCVKTVFHVDSHTTVPLAPPEVAGLANLRGRVVTLLRLDRCLGMNEAEADMPAQRLAVGVEHNGEEYALLIDETEDVLTVDGDARIDCPAHIDPRLRELLVSCYRVGAEFLSVLDVGALLQRVALSSDQTSRARRRAFSEKGARK